MPQWSESACSGWSMKKLSLPLSRAHTHTHPCAVSCLMVPCMWTSEIENYYTRTESRVPHSRTTTSQPQKELPGGAASADERGWTGVSATWRHDVTLCLKTHRLGSWKDCLIVFCSLYLLLGVWGWLFGLSVAESECMCVFSKRASRQEMTCPIVVGLDSLICFSSDQSGYTSSPSVTLRIIAPPALNKSWTEQHYFRQWALFTMSILYPSVVQVE